MCLCESGKQMLQLSARKRPDVPPYPPCPPSTSQPPHQGPPPSSSTPPRLPILKLFTGNVSSTTGQSWERICERAIFSLRHGIVPVALRAAIILPILLLQKPNGTAKIKENNIACLTKNMEREGDRLPKTYPPMTKQKLPSSFANLMHAGKTKAALDLSHKGQIHTRDRSIRPLRQGGDCIMDSPIIFEANTIRSAAL